MQDGAGATVQSEDYTALPSTRAEALALGAKTYFNGKPCRQGHLAPRYAKNAQCLECSRVAAREWGQNNREAVSRKNKSYYLSNKAQENARSSAYKSANKGKISEYNFAYYRENIEAIKERDRLYNKANRKKIRDWNRAFHASNPLKNAEYHAKRRARTLEADGFHTAEDIEHIIRAQKGRCAACRKKRNLTVDHIIPLSKGGSNHPSNLQMLCKSCNSAKHANDPISFMQSRGYLL